MDRALICVVSPLSTSCLATISNFSNFIGSVFDSYPHTGAVLNIVSFQTLTAASVAILLSLPPIATFRDSPRGASLHFLPLFLIKRHHSCLFIKRCPIWAKKEEQAEGERDEASASQSMGRDQHRSTE